MAGYAREKYWFVSKHMKKPNIKFLTSLHGPNKDPAESRKFSSSHPIEKWVLYFPLSWCRFISCESGVWTKRDFRNSGSP